MNLSGKYDNEFGVATDPYPGWGPEDQVPITTKQIKSIFARLTAIFGFQKDSSENMFDYLMRMLDSRASRLGPFNALRTLHGDYIGGPNANFRKWYFAAEIDIDDAYGWLNVKRDGTIRKTGDKIPSTEKSIEQWYKNMLKLSASDYVTQVALYLLCWGEANNVRFMPECLCFIFKCCNDYYFSLGDSASSSKEAKGFLDHIITPLYNTYKSQCYEEIDGVFKHTDKDHASIIGYDDMNQLFWYKGGLEHLKLEDKTPLMSLKKEERYSALAKVRWNKAFFKTYYEVRTWFHLLVNFNRVFILHLSVFWCYTAYNSMPLYTFNYSVTRDNKPPTQVILTILSLGGGWATFLSLIGLLLECRFVPRSSPTSVPILKRFAWLTLLSIINIGPTAFIFLTSRLRQPDQLGTVLSGIQFAISVLTILYLVITTPSKQFGLEVKGRKALVTQAFTSNFAQLTDIDKVASYLLWFFIFMSKFVESYFFLTLSLKEPVRELAVMRVNRCAGDRWLGTWLCNSQPMIILMMMILLDFILFFLDTYLWYIIWNTFFSVFRSFYIGSSIWTPWRNIFSRLPKRVYSKLLVTTNNNKANHRIEVSKVWNSIIISMYREHFLSLEQVQRLLYEHVASADDKEVVLREPTFFVSQEDDSLKNSLFHQYSEAQRRITFFAQSLSTPMPDIKEIKTMPSFTVLVPHYSETILLLLKDIIKEEDRYTHVTMLEYLKQLHPLEWTNFVRDTKMMAEESQSSSSPNLASASPDKYEDLPYNSVGFKVATPEYVTRTRIWASLRSQTLYRTVTGFMNYTRAIKLLYDLEVANDNQNKSMDENRLQVINEMAARKFRLMISMQRYKKFNAEEKESTEFLLRTYPELQIVFIDEEEDEKTKEKQYFSALIDGSCAFLENGDREPKYRIRLSGYPILGDGKSDNQNHALVFTRGEYIQLIDANQDNYIEECLKIRNTLAEFEEQIIADPYSAEARKSSTDNPVAIIGTREYIFSENVGILGDVAAAKEQTFGTLFARTMAQIGGKLHYGHPDFLNAIFVTTRGGVSKAQKGLHLNEDIYAGMNAVIRGGRIKHCEYMQCGKGRDLGFSSISNFITKIGAGMGEQLLSREYYFLGTKLPLDRFLSFYYAHAGFHLNNVCIILSIQMFLLVGVNIASLTNDSVICEYNKDRPFTDSRRPLNCLNLVPVYLWLERCILSIFLVLMISFVPLAVQELTERGIYKCFTRLGKHFISLSPLFEVFVCKIYATSLTGDLAVGGAQYIATGRNFATKREAFLNLYARFANEALNAGAIYFLFVIYISISWWKYSFIYFWITVIGLLICPYLFNPNQFSFNDFFIDYKKYLQWLFTGNRHIRDESWIAYTKMNRSRFTGLKLKLYYGEDAVKTTGETKPTCFNILLLNVFPEFCVSLLVCCAYLFSNAQAESRNALPSYALVRLLLVSIGPIVVNMVVLILFFIVSLVLGPVVCFFFEGYPTTIASLVHIIGVLSHVFFIMLLATLQNFDTQRTLVGVSCMMLLQRIFLRLISALFLTRELRHSKSNSAWWSGKWVTSGLGWMTFTQPIREFVCKVTELTYFTSDLFVGHAIFYIQIPLLLSPLANTWHSLMLLWAKPGSQLRKKILSRREQRKQTVTVVSYLTVFVLIFLVFFCLFILPVILVKAFKVEVQEYLPEFLEVLRQPERGPGARRLGHSGLARSS